MKHRMYLQLTQSRPSSFVLSYQRRYSRINVFVLHQQTHAHRTFKQHKQTADRGKTKEKKISFKSFGICVSFGNKINELLALLAYVYISVKRILRTIHS